VILMLQQAKESSSAAVQRELLLRAAGAMQALITNSKRSEGTQCIYERHSVLLLCDIIHLPAAVLPWQGMECDERLLTEVKHNAPPISLFPQKLLPSLSHSVLCR
jgi:hypothetical protein